MKKDDYTKMAREFWSRYDELYGPYVDDLVALLERVAAEEREECAKEADNERGRCEALLKQAKDYGVNTIREWGARISGATAIAKNIRACATTKERE